MFLNLVPGLFRQSVIRRGKLAPFDSLLGMYLKRPKSELESFEIGAGLLENAATILESAYGH